MSTGLCGYSSTALPMKCSSVLSNMVTRSDIKFSSSFHSSKYSKLTLDKQQTAVRSSLVGSVISEHKLLCRTVSPKSFCCCGRYSLQRSVLTMYGSPVSALVCTSCHHKSLAEIVLTACLDLGSIRRQGKSCSTAYRYSSDKTIPLCKLRHLRLRSPPVVFRIAINSSISG